MINLSVGYKSEITIRAYIREMEMSEFERVHEITFKEGKKLIQFNLDRIQLQELIGVLEVVKEMKL